MNTKIIYIYMSCIRNNPNTNEAFDTERQVPTAAHHINNALIIYRTWNLEM